jgi:hypothetical protein
MNFSRVRSRPMASKTVAIALFCPQEAHWMSSPPPPRPLKSRSSRSAWFSPDQEEKNAAPSMDGHAAVATEFSPAVGPTPTHWPMRPPGAFAIWTNAEGARIGKATSIWFDASHCPVDGAFENWWTRTSYPAALASRPISSITSPKFGVRSRTIANLPLLGGEFCRTQSMTSFACCL